jgi:hypothetical protein
VRHVDADNLAELALGQQRAQQVALTATEVQHTTRTACLQTADHRGKPLLIELERRLDGGLFRVARRFGCLEVRLLIQRQPRERLARQAAPMPQRY